MSPHTSSSFPAQNRFLPLRPSNPGSPFRNWPPSATQTDCPFAQMMHHRQKSRRSDHRHRKQHPPTPICQSSFRSQSLDGGNCALNLVHWHLVENYFLNIILFFITKTKKNYLLVSVLSLSPQVDHPESISASVHRGSAKYLCQAWPHNRPALCPRRQPQSSKWGESLQ